MTVTEHANGLEILNSLKIEESAETHGSNVYIGTNDSLGRIVLFLNVDGSCVYLPQK